MLLLDVDHFKRVNDTFGHAGGDVVLREVAQRLRSNLRSSDIVARYGGEEFLVIMASRSPADVANVAERLRLAVGEEPVWLPSGPVRVTISIGGASGGDSILLDDLLASADEALYRAKAAGRNRLEIARSGTGAAA